MIQNRFIAHCVRLLLLMILAGIRVTAFAGHPGTETNENAVYRSYIKTVQLYKSGFEMSAPVMVLNSGEHLQLAFDDLSEDLKRYNYTIVHCEADWSVSDLAVSDYIDGFREENIGQFAYSYNTTIPYIHFSLEFPTDNMRVRISGNYILKVYEDDPSDVIITRRFMIVEPSPVGVTGQVRQAPSGTDRFTKQEVGFVVDFNGFRVADPNREIKVVITQNDRWDNAIRNLKPRFAREGSLDYNSGEQVTFFGGNEFRNLDTKSLLYQSERIRKIDFDTGAYHVYLLDDLRRNTKNWVTDKDINGRMYIKNEEHAQNNDTESDYAWVHFFVPCDPPLVGAKVYIMGQLTDWQISDASQMRYNPFRKGYEKKLFLKQGYYNYLYIVKGEANALGDETAIEGSHWETENEYTVWVYFHETAGLADRLVAVQNLTLSK